MSTSSAEKVAGPPLSPREFLESFAASRECFPLVDGMIAGQGETENVHVANYAAPMVDFLDTPKHIEHLRAGSEAPRVELPLEIAPDFKYAFDAADIWFRVGKGAFLHLEDRRVPVRLVTIDYEQFSATWIYRDERDEH